MSHLDIRAKAEIGKSLAGFTLGEKLESFLPYVNQTILANYCVSYDVVLALGNAFSQYQSAEPFMRFNVTQAIDSLIFEALYQ